MNRRNSTQTYLTLSSSPTARKIESAYGGYSDGYKTATRSRRLVRFQLTKEQGGSCQALGHRIAELMPEPFKNHASRTSRLRRCYASLTQNLERLRDGISDSGSEEQALKINPYRIHMR